MAGVIRALFVAALVALPLVSVAVGFEDDYEKKSWGEIEPQLPVPPKAENLVAFYVSATTDNQFYIDRKSLSVGEEGVVRYTLVVVTPSGARNVSYEGIRCETGELRLYAFGRGDGSWGKSRGSHWLSIDGSVTRNRHHVALFSEYFCPVGGVAARAVDILRALDRGGDPVRQ